jgi:hypothetical protein
MVKHGIYPREASKHRPQANGPATLPLGRRVPVNARRLLHNPFSKDSARSFEARLALTFVLVLGAVGVIQYTVSSREISARIVEEGIARNSVAAANLLHALRTADEDEEPFAEITELLYALAQNPGTEHALLFDPQGAIAAASDRKEYAQAHQSFGVAQVLETGKDYVVQPSAGANGGPKSKVSYFSPVSLPNGTYVLEVAQTERVLSNQIPI